MKTISSESRTLQLAVPDPVTHSAARTTLLSARRIRQEPDDANRVFDLSPARDSTRRL
jgi:hypothetical protein